MVSVRALPVTPPAASWKRTFWALAGTAKSNKAAMAMRIMGRIPCVLNHNLVVGDAGLAAAGL